MAKTKNFTLRLPLDMYEELKKVADSNFRPLSKEILVAIQEHLEKNSRN
ncbi:Arc family DNA-binding protein [Limosilactobacillus mucosae]|nr:Arc family DNA-binding protein [Limosilactobacillus mucosae]